MEIQANDSLERLLSGDLKGAKNLSISQNLETFPKEIFSLADTLEFLDLSTNVLSELPNQFADLKKLRILFLSQNQFTKFPEVLSQCPNLEIIGFKANKISFFPENSFPLRLRWLILTNNNITDLPKSLGNCNRLQKLMLAGNKLTTLPRELGSCLNLQLLRVSANHLDTIPEWLFEMPNLSWLAFSGNPCFQNSKQNGNNELSLIPWKQIEIGELLGTGASGFIHKAYINRDVKEPVAIKIFKDTITSDGIPMDEMNAAILAGEHPNLIPILGKISEHPEEKLGLVLKLIPEMFTNLGGPPNYETCSRDTFSPNLKFSCPEVLSILKNLASVAMHLHKKGIMHGDFYAHNTLIDLETSAILFGDFGAATRYDPKSKISYFLERIEVRAFGCLIEDLLGCLHSGEENSVTFQKLNRIKECCFLKKVNDRPSFENLVTWLDSKQRENQPQEK